MHRISFFAFCWLITITTQAQTRMEKYQFHYKEAATAANEKNYTKMIYHFERADSLRPNNYGILYNLAAGYVLTGQTDKVWAPLRAALYVNAGLKFFEDSDFDAVKTDPRFASTRQLAESLQTVIVKSETAFTLDDRGFHPEGITFDKKNKRWITGSIRKGLIGVRRSDGIWGTTFFKPSKPLYSVMGMRIDSLRRRLWVTTSVMSEMSGFTDSLDGRAAVVCFDADGGHEVARFEVSGGHIFGDLCVTASGSVFISDSKAPEIYHIDPDMKKMVKWKTMDDVWNLQGIDVTHDQQYIVIADYVSGIYRLSIKTGETVKLFFKPSSLLRGIDGLLIDGTAIYAIQNGTSPLRVLRLSCDPAWNKITSVEVIDNNAHFLGEPTLGCVASGSLYYIANSPWGAYDKNHQLDITKAAPPMIRRFTPEAK
ncbi:hypothetical protein L6Q79_06550 [bacterium]|nr:hypothetical protein [bacterium]NUN46043.1 hypothetical protein [bacterium]